MESWTTYRGISDKREADDLFIIIYFICAYILMCSAFIMEAPSWIDRIELENIMKVL